MLLAYIQQTTRNCHLTMYKVLYKWCFCRLSSTYMYIGVQEFWARVCEAASWGQVLCSANDGTWLWELGTAVSVYSAQHLLCAQCVWVCLVPSLSNLRSTHLYCWIPICVYIYILCVFHSSCWYTRIYVEFILSWQVCVGEECQFNSKIDSAGILVSVRLSSLCNLTSSQVKYTVMY